MGDRVNVTFRTGTSYKDYEYSPVVYLHWQGGNAVNILMRSPLRGSDVGYSCARFIGQACSEAPGNLSVGVYDAPDATVQRWFNAGNDEKAIRNIIDEGPGNNGHILVDLTSRDIFQYNDYFDGDTKQQEGKPRRELVGKLQDVHYKDDAGVYAQKNLNSSMLDAYNYDVSTQELTLTYKTGAKYKYFNVPRQIVIDMQFALSYGRYVNEHLKPAFKAEKIEDSIMEKVEKEKEAKKKEITSLPLDLIIELKQFAEVTAANSAYIKTLIAKIERSQM